jgi:adenylate cyclase
MKIIKTYLICVSILLLAYPAVSQDASRNELDSLIQKLKVARNDTNKVKLYLKVLSRFSERDSKEGLGYVQGAVDLSEHLRFKTSRIKSTAGRVYWKAGKTDSALKYHFEALKMAEEENDDPGFLARLNTNIGQDYADGGNYPEALKYLSRAKDIYIKIDDRLSVAGINMTLAWVYNKIGNFPEASKLNVEALKIFERFKDDYGIAIASANLASDLMDLGKDRQALPYLLKSSDVYIKTGDFINLAGNYCLLASVYCHQQDYPMALKQTALAFECGKKINDEICMGDARSTRADIYMSLGKFREAASDLRSAIGYYRNVNAGHLLSEMYSNLSICCIRLGRADEAKAALDSASWFEKQIESRSLLSTYLNGQQLYDSLTGNWKDAYFNYYQYIGIRDSIYNAENTKNLLQHEMQYQFDKQEADSKTAQERKDIHQRTVRNSILAGFAGALIFLVVMYRQRNKISKARKRSDELLLNILPAEVAEELKQNGSAEARQFAHVTVMFTDFKGFSQISEKLSPTELVRVINTCFKAFDEIIGKYNIEKIKTIGDSYMCAGGLPVESATHAEDVVSAALEIQAFMLEHFRQREEAHEEVFETRIGIHTGPVVAGIVGIKKFAYDIWGDTVNIASRMESSGEPGKVNISEATYLMVKDKFNCVHRGKLAAKNKGAIDMYFIETA